MCVLSLNSCPLFEWAVAPSIRSGHPLGLSTIEVDVDLIKVSRLKS